MEARVLWIWKNQSHLYPNFLLTNLFFFCSLKKVQNENRWYLFSIRFTYKPVMDSPQKALELVHEMKKKNRKFFTAKSKAQTICENERLYFRLSNNNSLKSFQIAINLYKTISRRTLSLLFFHSTTLFDLEMLKIFRKRWINLFWLHRLCSTFCLTYFTFHIQYNNATNI